MQLTPELPQPSLPEGIFSSGPQTHLIDSLARLLASNLTRREVLKGAAGLMIAGIFGSRANRASAQEATTASSQLYDGPGQASAADINPCGPETKVLELCFDNRPNEDGSIKTPDQQGVYRRFLRAGHPEDQSTPFFRAVCPDGAFPGAEDPQTCIDQVAQVPVPRATMADLADPGRATKFASSLAVPAAEPTAAPSPEPVAAEPVSEPPAQASPCETLLGTPLASLNKLTNPRIARNDRINWDDGFPKPLENLLDSGGNIPNNSGKFWTFLDRSELNPGDRIGNTPYKEVNGQCLAATPNPDSVIKNPSGSTAFPFYINNPNAAVGKWYGYFTINGQGAIRVPFRIVPS